MPMRSFQYLPILLLMTLLIACRVQNATSENPVRQVDFGYGGGFTGEIITYTLQEDGRMFSKSSMNDEAEPLSRISQREAQRLLKRAESLTTEYQEVNAPGNRYFFITYQAGDTTNTVTWGKPDYQVPAPIQDLYQSLTSKISSTQ